MRRTRTALSIAMAAAAIPAVTVPAAQACSWPTVIEADTVNLAYPDTGATYWGTRFAAVPGARLRIDGSYPAARYFSFHAYDEAQRPVAGLADLEIAPNPGNDNPFVTPGAPAGGSYTAFIDFSAPPPDPAPNTAYAGEMDDGSPNPGGFILYRVYVPDDQADPAGSVPLPTLTLETNDGAVALPLADCDPVPPSAGAPLTQVVRGSSFPNEVPRAIPWVPAQDPPQFVKFWSLSANVIDRVPSNPATDPLPRDTSGGFLSNKHINYLFALTSRSLGDLFVMRAKAPTAPDTRAGEDVTTARDMRYWSICQNNFVSQRFVQCLGDHEVVVDDDGFFTLVVSDPDDRPANAANWLPWGGPYYDGNVIYRHMLPARDFDGAIQRVPYGTPASAVMGDFFPAAAYCDQATFESGGWAACSA